MKNSQFLIFLYFLKDNTFSLRKKCFKLRPYHFDPKSISHKEKEKEKHLNGKEKKQTNHKALKNTIIS